MSIEQDIRDLHKLEEQGKGIPWKIDGVVNPEFRSHAKMMAKAYGDFGEKHGGHCLRCFRIYSTLKTRLQNVPKNLNKSTFKLRNSKGEGKFGA